MNALRRLRADDSGIGMVELLVSMMLSAVLLAMVGTMFVNIARATTSSAQSREGSSVAGTMANELSRVIRSAAQNAVQGQSALDPAVIAGSAQSVTLYSLTDTSAAAPAPTKIRFSVVGGSLVEERWRAVAVAGFWTFGTGAADSTRNLGGVVVAPTGGDDPLFVYLNGAGAVVPPGGTGLTADQRATVSSIRISVRVRGASSAAAPVVLLQNTVGMPNLAYTGAGR
jgi:Tfp pilus assembly protein PilV